MSNQAIQIAFLVTGIAVLTYLGMRAQRRVRLHEDMSVGGRTFTASSIFFTLYTFWGGNTIAGIVELAHRDGIASAWFGIARMTMFVIIFLVTGGAFRKLAMITLSSFIGRRFGSPFLKLVLGIIIALNFTIFTVSSVVGAAAFFTAILGWSLWVSVLFTVGSFLIYTTLGGMHAISWNAKVLFVGQLLALFVAAAIGIKMAGWENILHLEPRYFEILPAKYTGTVLMWFFTFIINAFVAQAALQIVMSSKTAEEGRKGILYVALGFIPIIVLAPLTGIAAKVLFPGIRSVQAMPMIASSMPSAILSAVVVLGFYFTTLGWAASCILSGGTVFANDIYRYFVPNATSAELIRASRVSIFILSLLTIGFALLIPSGVEFWSIVGFVLRNTALFPLILIGLFWNAISRRVAIVATLAGATTGVVWYLIRFPAFLLDAHPMFVGTVVSMIVLLVGTWVDFRGRLQFCWCGKGIIFTLAGAATLLLAAGLADTLIRLKSLFAVLSFGVSFFFVAVIFFTRRVDDSGAPVTVPFEMEG